MNFVRDLGTNGLNPLKKYVLKVDNRNATKRCEMCPKLRINTLEFTSFTPFFGCFYSLLRTCESLLGNNFYIKAIFFVVR